MGAHIAAPQILTANGTSSPCFSSHGYLHQGKAHRNDPARPASCPDMKVQAVLHRLCCERFRVNCRRAPLAADDVNVRRVAKRVHTRVCAAGEVHQAVLHGKPSRSHSRHRTSAEPQPPRGWNTASSKWLLSTSGIGPCELASRHDRRPTTTLHKISGNDAL